VIRGKSGGPEPLAATRELTSLDERLGLLLIVRIGVVLMVVLGALFASNQTGFSVTDVGPLSAGYLTVAAGAEWYRRSQGRGRMLLQRIILPLDAVYLAIVTTPGGGPRSQLVVLFAVQLIAVTLLASERAGIRIALWDTFLFIIIPTLSLSGSIGSLLGLHLVAAPPAAQTALAIMGFWVVALCTAFFSSVSERELRRSKLELEALAEMASRLEGVRNEGVRNEAEILALVLRTLVDDFPFRRGAVWWLRGGRPEGLTLAGTGQRVTSVPIDPRLIPGPVAKQAWAGREPLLVRQIDPSQNPIAGTVLPSARNAVVLPLQIDSRDSGIVLLEHGGNPLKTRLPRRTLVMLSQFTAHAALALRNVRLLAERERQAAIDGLTGLANRREFDLALAREVSRSERTGDPLSLVVLDLDHFKEVNDSRGHLAGDEVLRAIGKVLASSVREMDLVARYGGEEFAMVLPRCDLTDAVAVVARVTDSVGRHEGLQGITLSSGVASLPLNASAGVDLVAAADEALYESKRAGRNRYTVSNRHGNSHRADSRSGG
jgi:diguanylate cyclase (GGDEF)-like protein